MQATQGTIRVVDDTELNQVMLSNWLREQGHQVVTAHGGRVQADNAPGQGATFTLYFPLVNPLPAAAPPGAGARFDDTVTPLHAD